jgi:hypothetical protein
VANLSAVITLLLASLRMVTGNFTAREPRLSDALNNRLHSSVLLENAQLGRYGDPSAHEPVPLAVVPKQQIVIAYEVGALVPAVPSGLLPSYVLKQRAELLLLAGGLRISGNGHGLGKFGAADLQQVVHNGEDHFLPITDVSLALDVEGSESTSLPFIVLNLRHLQFVARIDLARAAPARR